MVNYGKYGIVFNRDFAIEKFDLNPVFYVKNEAELETTFKSNFENSIIPQTLHIAKDFYSKCDCKKFTDHINISPLNNEIKDLLNTLDKNVNDSFIKSIQTIFENYFVNSLKQVLVLKPFKVENKQGETKIAYNEREWRKSFFDLNFISEYKPNGEVNEEYLKWSNTTKPHFREKYTLDFNLNDVKCIYVEKQNEVKELQKFIYEKFKIDTIEINTLTEYKLRENAS